MKTTFDYPVSINGKVKTNITFPINEDRTIIEKSVCEFMSNHFDGKEPKAFIFRRNRIINIVI
jgi:leucyl-tRNA synthetase